jgi:nitrite reductase (NADH) small subunit
MASRFVVDRLEDFPAGTRRVFAAGGRDVAIFNVDGAFYAMRNVCPHHGASLCTHGVRGTMVPSEPHEYQYGMDKQVVRCPWHGFEFDVRSGRSLVGGDTMRVKTYRVEVEDEDVVLYL